MAKNRKSAREKLEEAKGLPKIVMDTPKGAMLVPKPLDVDSLIRKVKRGKLVTVGRIRERLARDFGVDWTCPMTTGIFIRVAAEAAEEDLREGRREPTPYWRVIKTDGSLNEKFPGGTDHQAARLIEEGHAIEPGKGKKPPKVKEFEKSLQEV